MEYLRTIEKDAFRDRAKTYLTRIRQETLEDNPITEEDIKSFKVEDMPTNEQVKWYLEITVESFIVSTIITVFTVIALFGDDVRILYFQLPSDDMFFVLACMALGLFAFEFVVSCIVYDDYIFGFYFYLDFLAVISVVPDIGWVWNLLFPEYAVQWVVDNATAGTLDITGDGNSGAGGKAAAKTARIIRIIRMVRLLRFVKLYKQAQAAKLRYEKNKNKKKKKDPDEQEIEIPEESKVSKRLSERTNQKVISLVLVMVFMLPMLDAAFWDDSYLAVTYEMEKMEKNYIDLRRHNYSQNQIQSIMHDVFTDLLDNHGYDINNPNRIIEDENYPLLFLHADVEFMSTMFAHDSSIKQKGYINKYTTLPWHDYRSSEVNIYFGRFNLVAIFSKKYELEAESNASIIKTIFICFVLTYACYLFSNDSEELVLNPIERMINYVKKVIKNPLNIDDIDTENEEMEAGMQKEEEEMNKLWSLCFTSKKEKKEDVSKQMETRVLENSLRKICNLLVIGVGEAGKDVIIHNIQKKDDLNAMLSGKKCYSIYGIVNIRHFTETADVLQEEILIFLNSISAIIHKNTDVFLGTCNKNTGDMFLLVWKVDEKDSVKKDTITKTISSCLTAEFALMSFLKTIYDINNENKIKQYRKNEQLSRRVPDYKVKLCFGLHQGYSIEGAIGSEMKIDATYISSNINMVKKLESLTKLYDTDIIMSGEFVKLMRKTSIALCRKIDKCTMKAFPNPTEIWTFDINVERMEQDNNMQNDKQEEDNTVNHSSIFQKHAKPFMNTGGANEDGTLTNFANQMMLTTSNEQEGDNMMNNLKIENEQLFYESKTIEEPSPLETHPVMSEYITKLQAGIPKTFKETFDNALNLFIEGRWKESRKKFEEVLKVRHKDGPSIVIYEYMQNENNFCKPDWWKGSRMLDY